MPSQVVDLSSQLNLRSRPAKIHYDNQENIQPQAAAAVAATSSPNETVGSITQTDQGKSSSSDQEKSLSSSDQHQISVSGVYSLFSDSVPAQSIAQNPGVGSAISREVGNNWISARPSHVEGNKLEEAGDLSPSKNEKSRLNLECLLNSPDKYVGRKGKKVTSPLDCVFLDCTFATFSRSMPTKQSSIQQVVNCIWKHPDASKVYLTCDVLGQEDILVQVSQTFGAKIYVNKAQNPECFKNPMVTAPEIRCEDPSARFHLFDGSPGLYERAQAKLVEAKATLQTEPLIVRPSAP
ncbi:hypothetical protein KIW84_034830 [Lathyrus oleraceus]|uniref:Uncharacterized protein n=1 Tax=Pisum sativum TaxID=3888 RepID=A0A9D4Y4Y5_PEA|nr:hypothetical protein KIW84_034830 [Pisum sativum]